MLKRLNTVSMRRERGGFARAAQIVSRPGVQHSMLVLKLVEWDALDLVRRVVEGLSCPGFVLRRRTACRFFV
jgi:hypothetical protein